MTETHSLSVYHQQSFFDKPTSEVYDSLDSSSFGLNQEQVQERRLKFGLNKLKEKKGYSVWELIIGQFNDLLVVILLLAGVFSFVVGEVIDAAAIFLIVIVNGLLGFMQEFKAEKSLEELKKMETLKARVIRQGEEMTVDSEELVPGDILVLHEGERVPADARVIETHSLQVDESMLTGESLPVTKQTEPLAEKTALADRKNMVYSSSAITKGRGRAVVTTIGMQTEIGQIATQIQEAPEGLTPLQKALDKLGRVLGIMSLAVAVPGLVIGLIMGREVVEMLMMAISLAVSAIPEGLPIVVTIALALGIKRMTKVNVLVRKLSTAESLGGTDVICSDKTGTITHNQMTVQTVFTRDQGFFQVSGRGFQTEGKVEPDVELNKKHGFKTNGDGSVFDNLIRQSVLSSDATLDFGDPTEKALVVALRKLNLSEDQLREQQPRLDEIPFDSASKFMAVTVKSDKKKQAIIKGAPEIVLGFCDLSSKDKQEYLKINEKLSSQGLRVLAVAGKVVAQVEEMSQLEDYQFQGLIGMYDPPREEVRDALNVCQQAGIRVLMITGDHKKTAEAIADQIGLQTKGVVTGNEIDAMDETDFSAVLKVTNVFARVSPRHKVQILTGLQDMGHQVAMTGDGVNDAPAIKKADVGIAVGSGTDLTKGISDMILLDDNFATIPKAIKEGRRIFFNIKKFVRFLISANFDEIAEIFTSIIFSIPLSFMPIQILWLNLATDSLPALALTTDVASKDIMRKKPYNPKQQILTGVIPFSILAAIIAYISTFGLFLMALYVWNLPLNYARTLAFTSTVLFEFFLVFAIRSERSAFEIGIFSNKLLVLSVILGTVGQFLAVYHPLGQQIFDTVPLTLHDWSIITFTASSGFVVIELLKLIKAKLPRWGSWIPIGDETSIELPFANWLPARAEE